MGLHPIIRACTGAACMLALLAGTGGCATRAGRVEHRLPAAAHVALEEANRDFTCAGRPIHPGLVHEFEGWLSDGGPITLAVDVRAACWSDEYPDSVITARDGRVSYEVPGTSPAEWYAYEHMGRLANGTHVLRTVWSGGGSGRFVNLLLVRLHIEPAPAEAGSPDYRLVMSVQRSVPLGDRHAGAIRVRGDRVIVEPSARLGDREPMVIHADW